MEGCKMAHKNIFEILNEQYDVQKEFNVINKLFYAPTIAVYLQQGQNQLGPVEQAIDSTCFYSWKQRNGCVNLADVKEKLEFENRQSSNKEDMIVCLEYMCNIIYLANSKLYYNAFHMPSSCQKTQQFIMLEDNIELLLNHLNYEKQIFEDQEKVILIPSDPAATATAEISSKETAIAILQYHHASLKGQLAEKKDILRRIAQEHEPILDAPIDGYTDYFKTAKNMLNNLDIRHNNKAGKKKNNLVINLTDEELEKWYDELYQLLLFCVLIKDNRDRKNTMEKFLKRLQEKK